MRTMENITAAEYMRWLVNVMLEADEIDYIELHIALEVVATQIEFLERCYSLNSYEPF